MACKVLDVYKVGSLTWEIAIQSDTGIIYYFRAWTRRGAEKKATMFADSEECK